jgi:hypothetical protein
MGAGTGAIGSALAAFQDGAKQLEVLSHAGKVENRNQKGESIKSNPVAKRAPAGGLMKLKAHLWRCNGREARERVASGLVECLAIRQGRGERRRAEALALRLLNQNCVRMILNAEALEVLAYLKSCPGQFVAMRAISRQAGGRRRFEESPGWAKGLMGPLVEAGMIEVNERGHFRVKGTEPPTANPPKQPRPVAPVPVPKIQRKVVGGDYFPAVEESRIVGDNYFPHDD